MGNQFYTDRRRFGKLAITSALAVLPVDVRGEIKKSRASTNTGQQQSRSTSTIKIGTRLSPTFTDEDVLFFRQLGVEYATIWTTSKDTHYEYFLRTRKKLEAEGINLLNVGNLDLHCDPTLVLGLPGRDEKIEQYKTYLLSLGKAGIHYTTYAHMANIKILSYYQTETATTRGGTKTRLFDMETAKTLPLSHGRVFTEEEIWSTFTYFIRAVMPIAEKAKVRIGLHPDDPPVPSLGGVARIFRNFEAYQRAIQLADSDNFGLCFCVGTWAEGGKTTGKDVFEMIRYFGPRGRIFKVHFRNVDSPLPRFKETFVDNGYLDMHQVLRTLRENRFNGVTIPDHVPGDGLRGINTAYTIGYMKALLDRVNAEAGGT